MGYAYSYDSLTDDAEAYSASLKDIWILFKPGVMSLVVFTAAVGLFAAPVAAEPFAALIIILSIAMGSAGGAAINMWYDADIDRIMERTKKRPLPQGSIAEQDVLAIGLGLSAFSVLLLGLASNWMAGGLLAFAIWFYACFYTMMLKRHTVQNIVIGGAAGAFPPLIGWLAVSPQLAIEPILFFLIIFFWTPPHFWALALYRHQDYSDAHIPMLPSVRGERSTLQHILIYSVLLIAISIMPYMFASLSICYAVAAVSLGALFLRKAIALYRNPQRKTSMQLFGFSILYLFALFAAIMVDKFLYSHIVHAVLTMI